MVNLTAQSVLRGIPASDDHKPVPSQFAAYLEQIEKAASLNGAWYFRDTFEDLNGVSGAVEGDGGLVLTGDAGVYERGTSSWIKVAELPRGFAYQNLDDTADEDKPVSIPQQTALDGKVSFDDAQALVPVYFAWTARSFYNTQTQTFQSSNTLCTSTVPVSGAGSIVVSGNIRGSSGSVSLVVFLDDAGSFISKHLPPTSTTDVTTYSGEQIAVPSGAASVVLSTTGKQAHTVSLLLAKLVNQQDLTTVQRKAVLQAQDDVTLIGLNPVADFWSDQQQYLSTSGQFVAGTSWRAGEISAVEGEVFVVSAVAKGSVTQVAAFLDDTGTMLAAYLPANQNSAVTTYYSNEEIVAPPGTSTLRYCTFVAEDFQLARVEKKVAGAKGEWLIEHFVNPVVNGYLNGSGAFVASGSTSWTVYTFPAVEGQSFRYSGTMAGSVARGLAFWDASGSPLAVHINPASNNPVAFVDQVFTAPPQTAVMVAAFFNATEPLQENRIERLVSASLPDAVAAVSSRAGTAAPEATASFWAGKKIVWMGTSIPAGGGLNSYPNRLGDRLGATVENIAVSSSCARTGVPEAVGPGDTYGWTDQGYHPNWGDGLQKSLAMTVAEKQEMIDDWDAKWGALIGGAKPTTAILDFSYERSLTPHLDADLFVFDHGRNDAAFANGGLINGDLGVLPAVDVLADNNGSAVTTRDRRWFWGAINYLVDHILDGNPKARFIFITHYEDDRSPNVVSGQLKVGDYWNAPILKLHERTGWSGQIVPSSGLSLFETWMPDTLHPDSDTTGEAIGHIVDILASEFLTLR